MEFLRDGLLLMLLHKIISKIKGYFPDLLLGLGGSFALRYYYNLNIPREPEDIDLIVFEGDWQKYRYYLGGMSREIGYFIDFLYPFSLVDNYSEINGMKIEPIKNILQAKYSLLERNLSEEKKQEIREDFKYLFENNPEIKDLEQEIYKTK